MIINKTYEYLEKRKEILDNQNNVLNYLTTGLDFLLEEQVKQKQSVLR